MTNPIRKDLLRNTITIFNHYKDEDGNYKYQKSIVRNCLCYDKKDSFSVNNYGEEKVYKLRILFDRVNTSVDNRKYINWSDWIVLNEEDKKMYWTLRTEDVIIKGEFDVETFENYEGEKYTLKEKVEYQDKDGSIHSREAICI